MFVCMCAVFTTNYLNFKTVYFTLLGNNWLLPLFIYAEIYMTTLQFKAFRCFFF